MSKRKPLDFQAIFAAANGRWVDTVFPAVGIRLASNPNKHQPCPLCGGTNRFRCDDIKGDGTYICSQCGNGNGLTLVKKFTNGDSYEAYKAIATAIGMDTDSPITDAQRQAWRDQQVQREAKEAEHKRIKRLQAQQKANEMWSQAQDADPQHAYLQRKQIAPVGIKQLGDNLLVPVCYYDMSSSQVTIVNIQSIYPAKDADGKDKPFLSGGRVTACYMPINFTGNTDIIFIAEGYATAISILMAVQYKYPVVVAFNANNLIPVAQVIRSQYQGQRIIICADDDTETAKRLMQDDIDKGKQPKPLEEYNAGIHKAKLAAKAIAGEVLIPTINNNVRVA